jgi:hyperpolarization activated cyclic nucleotide-gated potassium channel 2
VEEYMRYHKIPGQLKVKVRNYFYHRYHGRLFNEKTMLKELSHVLEEV